MSDRLLIFCKHPDAGSVKSRLAKKVGNALAANIYKKIIIYILKQNVDTKFDIILYCYPNSEHSFFHFCQEKFNLTLIDQTGDNLGARMFQAMQHQLSKSGKVVLIGSDCPELTKDYIDHAFNSLGNQQDLVLGPTYDGGYALIGANKIDSKIFENIIWSTDSVLEETENNIKRLGWRHFRLPIVRDIDTYEDYMHFANHEEYQHIFT